MVCHCCFDFPFPVASLTPVSVPQAFEVCSSLRSCIVPLPPACRAPLSGILAAAPLPACAQVTVPDGPSLLYPVLIPACSNSSWVAIASPAPPARPVSPPHRSHLCLTNARPRPLPTLLRSAPPPVGSTNNRVGLETLGGPAANAHAVGGPPAGIGGEATAFCPHSGRGAGGPRGAPAVKMASTADGDVGETLEQMRGLWPGVEDLSLNKLATSLGASEQALRLIFSIFLGKDPPACLCPLVESQGNRQNGDWGQDLPICPEPP